MVALPFLLSSNAFRLLFLIIVKNTDGVRGIFMAEEPKQGKQRQMTWVTPLLCLLTWHLENNNSHTKQMEPRWEGWKEKWLNWYCWTHTRCERCKLMPLPHLSNVSSWWLGQDREPFTCTRWPTLWPCTHHTARSSTSGSGSGNAHCVSASGCCVHGHSTVSRMRPSLDYSCYRCGPECQASPQTHHARRSQGISQSKPVPWRGCAAEACHAPTQPPLLLHVG